MGDGSCADVTTPDALVLIRIGPTLDPVTDGALFKAHCDTLEDVPCTTSPGGEKSLRNDDDGTSKIVGGAVLRLCAATTGCNVTVRRV